MCSSCRLLISNTVLKIYLILSIPDALVGWNDSGLVLVLAVKLLL